VSEDEIVAGLRRLVLEAKLVCEPSGATAMAGYLADAPGRTRSAASVVIVSGGNVEPAMLSSLIG
jgi:threonine dehydratase